MKTLKKIGIIFGSAIALALIVLLVLWLMAPKSDMGATGGNATGDISAINQGAPAGLRISSSTTMQIGTPKGAVTVNNFYKNIISYEDEFVTIANTSDYVITYDTVRSAFYIQLNSSAARDQAEQALTGILGTSNTDTCKLNVLEAVNAGAPVKLSFCS